MEKQFNLVEYADFIVKDIHRKCELSESTVDWLNKLDYKKFCNTRREERNKDYPDGCAVKLLQTDHTGLDFSDLHRRFHSRAYASNLDLFEYDYINGEPEVLALFEWKNNKRVSVKDSSVKALCNLADKAMLPCFGVTYNDDLSNIIVYALNAFAEPYLSEEKETINQSVFAKYNIPYAPRANIYFKLLHITPEMAKDLLKAPFGNRKIGQAHIDDLARQMCNEFWRITNCALGFNREGKLMDGQHRLEAIIKSGLVVPVCAIFNLEDEAFDAIDQKVKKRSAGDGISVDYPHIQYKNSIGNAAKQLYLWFNFKNFYNASRGYANNATALKLYEEFPDLWDEAAIKTVLIKKQRLITHSQCIFFYTVFNKINPVLADRFFEGLSTGAGLEINDPVLMLREKLIMFNDKAKKESVTIKYIGALVIKTWNSLVLNEKRKKLFWGTNEELPTMKDSGWWDGYKEKYKLENK